MHMRSFSHLRSRTSMLVSLITLISITGGFAFFGWIAPSTHKALARGLTYAQLSPVQKRLLSGLLSSEYTSQRPRTTTTNAPTRGNYFPSSDDGCSQNLGNNLRVNSNCL